MAEVTKKPYRTRASTKHRIFGYPSELPLGVLPTGYDVCRKILLLKEEKVSIGEAATVFHVSNNECYEIVSRELINIYEEKAGLPTLTKRTVKGLIKNLFEEGSKYMKQSDASLHKMPSYHRYLSKLSGILDICSCKCKRLPCKRKCPDDCGDIHLDCHCDKKIRKLDLPFLFDQRGPRAYVIGGIDVKETGKDKRREERERKHIDLAMKERKLDTVVEEDMRTEIELEEQENDLEQTALIQQEEFETDPTFKPPTSHSKERKCNYYNTIPIPNIAMAIRRSGVSVRHGAMIANSTLIDYGIATPGNTDMFVSHNKLHYVLKKYDKEQQDLEKLEWGDEVSSVYFDGKKDATLVRTQIGEKFYTSTVLEEHYVLIDEPGGRYLSHVTPSSGHGISVANAIHKFLSENELCKNVQVIGCDGTNINVGHKKRAITYLENDLYSG